MSSRQISVRVVKELYAKSGNCCAFSGCNEQLFEDANVGQICHIQGVNPGSARYNPDLSEEVVNGIDNLILLCCTNPKLKELCDGNNEYYGAIGIYHPNSAIGHRRYLYRMSEGMDRILSGKVTRTIM